MNWCIRTTDGRWLGGQDLEVTLVRDAAAALPVPAECLEEYIKRAERMAPGVEVIAERWDARVTAPPWVAKPPPPDQSLRAHFAGLAMQAILTGGATNTDNVARAAVRHADALIKELTPNR